METMKNHSTPKWKEMAEQLKVDCKTFDIIERHKQKISAEEYKAIPILEKIDGVLNAALDRRDKAFRALVMKLTDLDENGAGELIEQATQYVPHYDLAYRMACCSEPPIVNGWCFKFNTAVTLTRQPPPPPFNVEFDDLPF